MPHCISLIGRAELPEWHQVTSRRAHGTARLNLNDALPMSRELMSKETRTEIREYLANWTLPQIEAAFRAADIAFTPDYRPPVIGTRRVMVERYYRSLDFTKAADAEKFVRLCDEVLRGIERRLQTEVGQIDHHRTAREQIVHWLR